jgi:RHS repeat-associated protein
VTIRNGTEVTKHIWAGGQRVGSVVRPEPSKPTEHAYWVHNDHLGGGHYVTTKVGAVYEQAERLPFGESWVEQRAGTDRVSSAFAGSAHDEESGLNYHGARYYDAREARWTGRDPAIEENMAGGGVLDPRNLGLYTYAFNSPVSYWDPDGRQSSQAPATGNPSQTAPTYPDLVEIPYLRPEWGEQMTPIEDVDGRVVGYETTLSGRTGPPRYYESVYDQILDPLLDWWRDFGPSNADILRQTEALPGNQRIEDNGFMQLTDAIVGETPQASGNAMLVMVGAMNTSLPLPVPRATIPSAPTSVVAGEVVSAGPASVVAGNVSGAAPAALGEVAIDANALIRAVEVGGADRAALDAAMAGRTPVVSTQAVKEYLRGRGVNRTHARRQLRRYNLSLWLAERGGRVAPPTTPASVQTASTRAFRAGRNLVGGDLRVLASTISERLSLITRDRRLSSIARAVGVSVEGF